MKRIKKLMVVLLSLTLVIGMLTGCKGKDATTDSQESVKTEGKEERNEKNDDKKEEVKSYNGIDISEEVTLKMYLLGDRTADFDKVYDEINKILKEKLNATVEVEFLSWSEHDTKYSLLFSAREDFDLIFTASSWGHYEETAALGGFYELTEDFIQTYAPDIWKVVPEVAWEQALIGGKVYMVPNYQNEFGVNLLAVRGDLMQKYGYSDITTWNDMIKYLKDVSANEEGMTALGSQGSALWYPYFAYKNVDIVSGSPKELFLYNTLDKGDLSIQYLLDWDGFAEYANMAKELYEAGCWSADALATTEERQDSFLRGTAAAMVWNRGTLLIYSRQANSEHPDWNCTLIDPNLNNPKKVNFYINNGVGINANSKNKERAMMVLNEFYTNTDIYDLASLGIEGTHWEAVGDKEYKILEGNANYGVDVNCNWGWTNANIRRSEYLENKTALDEKAESILKTWEGNIKDLHVYDGFTFDSTDVSTEMAAVNAVLDQYYNPILCGMAGDVDGAISTLKKQLDNAGIQTIYEAMKKQAEEFVAKKNQ